MLIGSFIALTFLLLVAGFLASAFAQYGTTTAPTPEQLEECKQIGIKPEKCTEQAILGTRCLGPSEACKNAPIGNDTNLNLIPIYIGIPVAFIAGVIYVKKTKDRKKEKL